MPKFPRKSSYLQNLCNYVFNYAFSVFVVTLCLMVETSIGQTITAQQAVFLDTSVDKQLEGWGFEPYASVGQSKKGWQYQEYDSDAAQLGFTGGYYQVCDTEVQNADNWLFSNYISLTQFNNNNNNNNNQFDLPTKIVVKIVFLQRNCKTVSKHSDKCNNEIESFYWKVEEGEEKALPFGRREGMEDVLVKRRNQFTPMDTLRTYSFLNSTLPNEPDKMTTLFHDITLHPSTDMRVRGIFLAFKDSQSCSFIKEIKVQSSYCPQTRWSLAEYPRTWPKQNAARIEGQCVKGAVTLNKYASSMHCLKEGTWDKNGGLSRLCKCDAGYEPNANLTQCNQCGVGKFKDTVGNTNCLQCPRNSYSLTRPMPGSQVSAPGTKCECNRNYLRAPNDSNSAPCELPPGIVQSLRATVHNTEVKLEWIKPFVLSTYSKPHLSFIVKCLKCAQMPMRRKTSQGRGDIGDNNMENPQFDKHGYSKMLAMSEVPFLVKGLRPMEEYTFEVLTVNALVEDTLDKASRDQITIKTQQEVRIGNITLQKPGDGSGGIIVSWQLIGSHPASSSGTSAGSLTSASTSPLAEGGDSTDEGVEMSADGTRFKIKLIDPQGGKSEIYTSYKNHFNLKGLAAGDWRLEICTQSEFETCSDVVQVNFEPEAHLQVINAGNLAIAAGLLVTVILTMLLVLVTAVCCYRRNVAFKYTASTTGQFHSMYGHAYASAAGTIGGHGHYNLMDVSLQSPVMDPSTMKLLYPHQQHHPSNPLSLGLTGFTPMGMGQGMQAFVDPTYYDDIDKLFMEFTREVHPQQLENLDSGNFSPHQYSALAKGVKVDSVSDEKEDRWNGHLDGYSSDTTRALLHHADHSGASGQQKSVVVLRGCDESSPQELRLMAIECATMSQFYHPNVHMLHGVLFQGPTVYMCLEDAPLGTLDSYLRACLHSSIELNGVSGVGDGDGKDPSCFPSDHGLSQLQLVHLLRGVACGMQYLAELGYIHKVLCANNVLVSGSGLCKVGGFEMRTLLEEEELQGHSYSKVVDVLSGWLAPEVINCRKWSSSSDVWAFGVLAWETLSHCQRPPSPNPAFNQQQNKSQLQWTKNSDPNALQAPAHLCMIEGMSPVLYEALMVRGCWRSDRAQRMNFAQIRDLLERAIRNPSHLHQPANSKNSASAVTMGTSSPVTSREPIINPPQKPQTQLNSPVTTAKISRSYSPVGSNVGATSANRPNPYTYYQQQQQQQQQQQNIPKQTSHQQQQQMDTADQSPVSDCPDTPDLFSYPVQQWLVSLNLQQYTPLFTQADFLTIGDLFDSTALRPYLTTLLMVVNSQDQQHQGNPSSQQSPELTAAASNALECLSQAFNHIGVSSGKHRRHLLTSLQSIVDAISAENTAKAQPAISPSNDYSNMYPQQPQNNQQNFDQSQKAESYPHSNNTQQVKQMNLTKESAVHVIM